MIRDDVLDEAFSSGSVRPINRCDVYRNDVYLGTIPLVGGSMSIATSSFTRRSASSVTVKPRRTPDATVLEQVSWLYQFGATVRLWSGAVVAGSPRWMPVHWGKINSPAEELYGPGTVTFDSPDLFARLALARFRTPRRSTRGLTVAQQIAQLVTEALPWVTFVDQSADFTAVADATWYPDRDKAVTELADAVGCEVFLNPRGEVVLRKVRDLTAPADFTISRRVNLVGGQRTSDNGRVRNVIVASSDRADGTNVYGASADNDPNSPTWVGYGEQVGYFTSSLLTTATQCRTAAYARRVRLTGAQVSASVKALRHVGVEAGDRVDVGTASGTTSLIADSWSYDLFGKPEMDLTGRTALEVKDVS